jgi:hypothetical protein
MTELGMHKVHLVNYVLDIDFTLSLNFFKLAYDVLKFHNGFLFRSGYEASHFHENHTRGDRGVVV